MSIYTVVQHSDVLKGPHGQFGRAVEQVSIDEKTAYKVLAVGGVVFRGEDAYRDADTFCEAANYPPSNTSMIPQVRGTFANLTVKGLRVYVPVREIVH